MFFLRLEFSIKSKSKAEFPDTGSAIASKLKDIIVFLSFP
ncbi:uncharacterized protein METZ01_LOCUS197556, partial [marine metagenome]